MSSNDTHELVEILSSYPGVDRHSCQLLGPTALIVQGLLGIFVILSLVYKRHRETPKRPWRIWLFDVSKQVVGQLFIHSANLLVSDLVSHQTSGNACVSYFLHILIDTTFGVALIYVILNTLTRLFTEYFGLKGFESGVYGNPPSIKYWACQAALYVLSLFMMKLIVITILMLFPGIYVAGEWLLSWTWTGKGDALQVVFTMGIFPIIMNITQFWLIDSIVKASAVAMTAQDIESTNQDREPLFRAPAEGDDDEPPRLPETANHGSSRCSVSSLDSKDLEARLDTAYQTTITIPDEHKSAASSSRRLVDAYAYPPSLSSSISSDRSSILNRHKAPKSAGNLGNKAQYRDRSADPPSESSSSLIPRTPSPLFTTFAIAQDHDVSEDTDDWSKENEHILPISKQNLSSTNGSWRSAHVVESTE